MADQTPATQQESDDGDPVAAVRTRIRDQWLVVSGWGASHADAGTPGPHVHLSTNDGSTPVLRTSQVPDLVDALHTVGGRVDRMWEEDGPGWFTGDEPRTVPTGPPAAVAAMRGTPRQSRPRRSRTRSVACPSSRWP